MTFQFDGRDTPSQLTADDQGPHFSSRPRFFANNADASTDEQTHAADMLRVRSATPLTSVTQSILSAPEETNQEEIERLRGRT